MVVVVGANVVVVVVVGAIVVVVVVAPIIKIIGTSGQRIDVQVSVIVVAKSSTETYIPVNKADLLANVGEGGFTPSVVIIKLSPIS